MSWHEQWTLGFLGAALTVSAFIVMIVATAKGLARPHPIAWYGFGALTAIGFLVQWEKGEHPGSLVLGFTFVACGLVGGISQWKGNWHLDDFGHWDWFALAAGLGCGLLYALSRNLSFGPLASAVWATFGDVILYWPIVRHASAHPNEENATGYFLNSIKFAPTLVVMNREVETWLYPCALIAMNAFVVLYLNYKRGHLDFICFWRRGASQL
jgi:hypothetical protein